MRYPATARLAAIQRRRIAFWDALHAYERCNGCLPPWTTLRALYAATRGYATAYAAAYREAR